MEISKLRRPVAFMLLAFAALGVPLAVEETGCTYQTRDAVTGEWRDATPAEGKGFADETGELFKIATTGTPAAAAMPWIELALRLCALFGAWRVMPVIKKEEIEKALAPAAQGAVGAVLPKI